MRDRKRFFETYAKANAFDPYNPENWYLQSIKRIMATKVSPSTHYSSLLVSFINFNYQGSSTCPVILQKQCNACIARALPQHWSREIQTLTHQYVNKRTNKTSIFFSNLPLYLQPHGPSLTFLLHVEKRELHFFKILRRRKDSTLL